MPKGKKIVRSPPPNLACWWGNPFCRDEVQAILKQSWVWRSPIEYKAPLVYYAYDTARAYSERPQKYSMAAAEFLRDYDWPGNAWFFSLCAAICAANANKTVSEKVLECSVNVHSSRPLSDEEWQKIYNDRSPEWGIGGMLIPDRGKPTIGHALDEIAWRYPEMRKAFRTEAQVSKVLFRERNRRRQIYDDWVAWYPKFWTPPSLSKWNAEWLGESI